MIDAQGPSRLAKGRLSSEVSHDWVWPQRGSIWYLVREKEGHMTTVLIIICILFCIGVVLAIVGHLGFGIWRDRGWRASVRRQHRRELRRQRPTV